VSAPSELPAAAPAPQPEIAATTPTTSTTAAATAPAQAPAPATAEPAGVRLWLGSLPSRDKAEEQWAQLRETYGDLFQDMTMEVGEVERDQRKFYRLLAGPLSDRDRGREICRQLQTRDPEAWCKVVGGS
jgi:cell division septation protein DedD